MADKDTQSEGEEIEERGNEGTELSSVAIANDQSTELPDVAKRALAEAEERRRLAEKAPNPALKEINGRDGPDPVRFGDWEKKGIAVDF